VPLSAGAAFPCSFRGTQRLKHLWQLSPGLHRDFDLPGFRCSKALFSRNVRREILGNAQLIANYQRNLMALTSVPTMTLVWVTKRSFSAPKKKPPAR